MRRPKIGLLSRFRVIVDYPQGRLYLVPAPDAASRPFESYREEGITDPDPITNPDPCRWVGGNPDPIC